VALKFISTTDAAAKADVTPRYIQKLCAEGRIKGAERVGRAWLVPASFKWTALPMGPKPKK